MKREYRLIVQDKSIDIPTSMITEREAEDAATLLAHVTGSGVDIEYTERHLLMSIPKPEDEK